MKLSFTQISPEVGTSFDLAGMPLVEFRNQLNLLGKDIETFRKRYKGSDYSVLFIIVATRVHQTVHAKGPVFRRSVNEVEFSVWIPFREIEDYGDRVAYVFGQLAQGVSDVLQRHESDPAGILDAATEAVRVVQANPEAYQYKSAERVRKVTHATPDQIDLSRTYPLNTEVASIKSEIRFGTVVLPGFAISTGRFYKVVWPGGPWLAENEIATRVSTSICY